MDKKARTHRRASSSSTSSTSSASSLTSSSSSSSSYDTRRGSSGRARSGGSYKDPRSKKSRPGKYSGSGERMKPKKAKSSQSLARKHISSKSSSRKSLHGHSSRKEYKAIPRDYMVKESTSKDYSRSYKSGSPVQQHRRSGTTKKSLSPGKRPFSPATRKGRKRSPSLHKKIHRRSISRERPEYQQSLSPSRPRDPRIERALKRSPEYPAGDARIRYERDPYEERRRDDRENRDGREKKLLKDRISFKDRFIAPDRDSGRDEGRFSRDAGYSGGRVYDVEREYYSRVESRESSLERKPYDDPYERFERERNRIENRNRYEELSHERMAAAGDYPIDPMSDRRRPLPIDNRFIDDRRKISHDMWQDDPRTAGASSSMIDRLQDPDSRAYSHHRRSSDWGPDGQGRRMHEGVGWDKQSPHRRRGTEWADDYANSEWRDRPREWESQQMDDHPTDWHPRRYQHNWNETDRGEWGGNFRKRGGAKSPNLPPPPPSQPIAAKKEPCLPASEPIITVTLPINEEDSFTKPAEVKTFSPVSLSKPQPDEAKISAIITDEKAEAIAQPLADLPSIEQDNFSDFSDDGDDILNQEPVNLPVEIDELPSGEDTKFTQGDATSYDEMLEEDGMDLEEISDDDLEEEKQVKYSVANALDIDWSTLTVDPNQQPAPAQTSALKRFSTLNILSRLGVSSKYASKEFLDDLIDKCYRMEMDAFKKKNASVRPPTDAPSVGDEPPTHADEPMAVTVKQEEGDMELFNSEEIAIKTEVVEENGMKKEDDEERETENGVVADVAESFADDLPQILPLVVDDGVVKHVRHSKLNRSRVFYLGRKALSSQDDIIIRRKLCNLPKDEMIFEKPQFNKDLFINAVDLLKM